MNLVAVDKIAKAVLYEGYMLYPYRPSSVKNRQRWNFGVLCPHSYSVAQNGSEAWSMQTECLVEGNSLTGIEVRIHFLQLVARTVGEMTAPVSQLSAGEMPKFNLVEKLAVNGRVYQPWQEALEREVAVPVCNLEALAQRPLIMPFAFPGEQQLEFLRESNENAEVAGVLVRDRNDLRGEVEVTAEQLQSGIFRVRIQIRNTTPLEVTDHTLRDDALLCAMVSAHTILGVQDGRFVSLLAPPAEMSELAAACKNVGTWPVLVGEEGESDTLLSSPIILYDYPQIAPESAGDLFDGTEIDEILSLRIMTLTDDEKREMSQSDERARQMLERTETMPVEHLMKLHGVLRGLRPLKEDAQ
jgi:hydrogenase maturation protease